MEWRGHCPLQGKAQFSHRSRIQGARKCTSILFSQLRLPILYVSPSMELRSSFLLVQIRLYFLSSDNKLREFAYDSNVGWYDGVLNNSNITLAPYSQVAATALLPNKDLTIRIYAQIADNTIQEFGWDSKSPLLVHFLIHHFQMSNRTRR